MVKDTSSNRVSSIGIFIFLTIQLKKVLKVSAHLRSLLNNLLPSFNKILLFTLDLLEKYGANISKSFDCRLQILDLKLQNNLFSSFLTN